MNNEALIELRHVSKSFGAARAVEDISLTIERGAIYVLLGASGCGKTTLLRLIAGLEAPDQGEIWLNGERVAGQGAWSPPEVRRIGMVFQDYALFPHMSVRQNILFALSALNGRLSSAERDSRAQHMLEMIGLAHCAKRFPHQLSGGEQQRVALARALAPNPSVVLLDEPFSNLDAALRRSMREDVRQILRTANATAIFVTHDQEEALSLADTVVIMREGKVQQVGAPQEVYLRPISREVAAFLGEANFIEGVAEGEVAHCALGKLPLAVPMHGKVALMIRPEALRVTANAEGGAEVVAIRFFGHDQLLRLRFPDSTELDVRTWGNAELALGERVAVGVRGSVMAYAP
ncbi:MAG: ABC transporter ATP-binding protein [Aggregatilineales bacterium]